MNTSTKILLALLMQTFFISQNLQAQNTFPSSGSAGIGTTTPDASSLLEIKSTTKGLLISRMTKNQRDAIVTPATGLMIYQTNNTPGFYYYSGTAWTAVTVKSKGWSLTGNAGTVPGTNFIGTTDAQPLQFKVNNNKAGLLDYDGAKANAAFGYQSLNSNVGNHNSAFGYQSLFSNTTGVYNTANGSGALYSNTTGSDNTANGVYALDYNTTGYSNTATGYRTLFLNTTGHDNTAIGATALYFNTVGFNNTATGTGALYSNTEGYYNTANGYGSLYSNTTGSFNTGNGYQSLYSNTTGFYNTAIGQAALYSNTTGTNNTASGLGALLSNTTGSDNTANGLRALYSNTEGYSNTANGTNALYSNTTGNENTANGFWSLYSNTTGNYNTANGLDALHSNTIGYGNTANGYYALFSNTTGYVNTAIGLWALYGNTSGYVNTGLGDGADVSAGNLSNATAIGYSAIVDASNKVRIGNTYVTSIGGQVGWSTFSDGRYKKNIKEDVKGLLFINSLRPVIYTVDINGLNEYYDKGKKHDSAYEKMKATMQPSTDEAAKIIYNGFIAQEVEAAAKKLNYDFSGVDKPQSKDGLYGLRYADFVVPLVKGMQELSKINDEKDAKIDDLQKQLNDLKTLVLSIQQCSPCNISNTTAQTYNKPIGDGSSLEQNVPNPFTHNTSIGYTLPQKFTTAQIMITDKSGKALKLVNISGSGKGNLKVDASVLASGAYNYSLLVDGKLIGTRQMEHLK